MNDNGHIIIINADKIEKREPVMFEMDYKIVIHS